MAPTKGIATQAPAIALPAWFEEYSEVYRAGAAHLFILHRDVRGLYVNGKRNIQFLQEIYYKGERPRDVILKYTRGTGFSFYCEEDNPYDFSMREKAKALVEPILAKRRSADPFGGAGGGDEDPFDAPMEPVDALRLIQDMICVPDALGRVAVFIDRADLLCSNSMDKATMAPADKDVLSTLLAWASSKRISGCKCPIVLIADDLEDLHADLRASSSGAYAIEIKLPDRDTRLAYLNAYLEERRKKEKEIPLIDLDTLDIANATAGLNLRQIQDICLTAYKRGGIRKADLLGYKNRIIQQQYGGVVELVEPLEGGLNRLGGMKMLKMWARRDLIPLMRAGSPDAPKGVLFPGPPGTGKSYGVRAIAGELGIPVLAVQPEKINNQYVGQSERALRRVFDLAKVMAPCVLFFDEFTTTGVQREGGGDPVGPKLFGMLLQAMADPDLFGKVVFIMADNRADKMDPAALRSGRFDVIMMIPLPDEEERLEVVHAQAAIQGVTLGEAEAQTIVARSKDYSNADLFAIVKKAKGLSLRSDHPNVLTHEEVTLALDYINPNTPAIANFYTMAALDVCNDTEFVPPKYLDMLKNRRKLKQDKKTEEKAVMPLLSDDREERDL